MVHPSAEEIRHLSRTGKPQGILRFMLIHVIILMASIPSTRCWEPRLITGRASLARCIMSL